MIIALAGNPNCGKTTVFNALTGLRQKVANYPGVTVEKKTGRCTLPDGRIVTLIDLPGTYSLISRSPDEVVAMEVLRGLRPETPAPDIVIVVVDASNLQRNLYLVSQLIELGRPLVIALNMMDVAVRRGIDVSPQLLEKELGVPVVPVIGHKREGIEQLKQAIAKARVAPLPNFPLPAPFKEELMTVGQGLAKLDSGTGGAPVSLEHGRAAHATSEPRAWICTDDATRRLDRYQAIAERLLTGDTASDLNNVLSHEPVTSLLSSSRSRLASLGIDPMQADIEAHYRWIESLADRVSSPIDQLAAMGDPAPGQVIQYETPRKRYLSDRLDAVLIHKVWGLFIFAAIMATIFVAIFWAAQPIMDGIEAVIGWLGKITIENRFWTMSDGPLKALIKDGIFAGVGGVVVFVPQIAILFFFLAVLEDSGYLARAAFLMDRVFAKVGLHGKSFIPLLSSFACAIPGIMATRTIEDRKSRLATIFIAPFMSCSARLPVYALLIGAFFAAKGFLVQGGIMLALYALGIIAAFATAWFFKRTLLKGPPPAFILELPTYKMPQAGQVGRVVFTNTWAFLAKAGTVIFCLSVVLWAMTYYPRLPEARVAELRAAWRPGTNDFQFALTPPPRPLPVNRTGPGSNLRQIGQALPLYGSEGLTIFHLSDGRRIRVGYGQLVSGTLTGQEQARLDERRDEEVEKQINAAQLRHSIAGRIGHFIEPVIKPLGYDWKMGVGLFGAFAAREVFVSTMGIIYSAGDSEDDTTDLEAAMAQDKYPDGRPVWTAPVAAGLLAFFVLAMQCMSTLAIVRRETGGWKWPIFMLVYMNALAYVVALGVYQIGRLIS